MLKDPNIKLEITLLNTYVVPSSASHSQDVDLDNTPNPYPIINLSTQVTTPPIAGIVIADRGIEEKKDGSPQAFDPNFLLSIIDPRDILIPITLIRVIWLFILISSVSLSFLLPFFYQDNKIQWLAKLVNQDNVALMILLYFYEPLFYSAALILTPKYPKLQITSAQNIIFSSLNQNNPVRLNQNSDLAIIIPCHNAAEFIEETIRAALKHVLPDQIFLVDNGRADRPTDLTKKVAHGINARINYFWVPKVASKNWAQYVAIKFIKENRKELIFALIIDDDTKVPLNFSVQHQFFEDEKVQGIVYPLIAQSLYKKDPQIVKWQRHEYLKADLFKFFEDQFGAISCPHGAAALLKIEALYVALHKYHNGEFLGEDLRLGFALKGEWRIDLDCYFSTIVPQTLLGNTPNLYQQRVRSWDQTFLLFPLDLVVKPLFTTKRDSVSGFFILKNRQLYTLYSTGMQIFRFPLMALMITNPLFWGVMVASNLVEIILGLVFNYNKLPPHLRSDLLTLATYPIYQGMLSIMSSLAFLRVLLVTGSLVQHLQSIGFQLGHNQTVIDDASYLPRLASDDSIISHLFLNTAINTAEDPARESNASNRKPYDRVSIVTSKAPVASRQIVVSRSTSHQSTVIGGNSIFRTGQVNHNTRSPYDARFKHNSRGFEATHHQNRQSSSQLRGIDPSINRTNASVSSHSLFQQNRRPIRFPDSVQQVISSPLAAPVKRITSSPL